VKFCILTITTKMTCIIRKVFYISNCFRVIPYKKRIFDLVPSPYCDILVQFSHLNNNAKPVWRIKKLFKSLICGFLYVSRWCKSFLTHRCYSLECGAVMGPFRTGNWAWTRVRSFDLGKELKKHYKWQNSHGARLQKQLQTALILSVTSIWYHPWVTLNDLWLCDGLWLL
jgi:hypothetical protein